LPKLNYLLKDRRPLLMNFHSCK